MVTKNNSTDSSKQNSSSDEPASRVVIALGSNIGQRAAMDMALRQLGGIVAGGRSTGAVWTEPIGMQSDRFLNCLFAGTTTMGLAELTAVTKDIERRCGRTVAEAAAGLIRMDIDILEYGGRRLRPADWERTYIKQLFEEI